MTPWDGNGDVIPVPGLSTLGLSAWGLRVIWATSLDRDAYAEQPWSAVAAHLLGVSSGALTVATAGSINP
jgi:hypothetical protein